MANKATESASETPEKRLVATYTPGKGLPGLRRVITKEQFADLAIDVKEDFVWEARNGHRLDVTGAPEALLAVLDNDKDIQVSEEG